MDPGEFFAFSKDFQFKLNRTDVYNVFRLISKTGSELDYQKFARALKPLAVYSI
jgi:hypothetical protein